MAMTRVLSKPTYSITLLFLIISTLIFLSLTLPSLVELHSLGQTKDGITIITGVLSIFLTIGFGVYSQQQAALARTDKTLTSVGSQLVNNNLIVIVNNKETSLKIKNQLRPDEYLKLSQLSDAEFLEAIPQQLHDRADLLMAEARQVAENIDFHREVSHSLDANSEALRGIAVRASNHILDEQDEKRLKDLGLLERSSRGDFYMDIYVYLKGWLRLSIEYDKPMPVSEISQSKLDRKLYIDTIKWIRDSKVSDFGVGDERQNAVIRKYLSILVSQLEA